MATLTSAPISEPAVGETASIVGFKTSQGTEVQATMLKLTPQSVTFEMYSPQNVLQLSEVLSDFNILSESRSVFSGRAVVSSLVSAGTVTVCEASLGGSVLDLDLFQLSQPEQVLPAGFRSFIERWQKSYRILPEYKLAVADMQSFLEELRLWLDQIELAVRSLPSADRAAKEREIVRALPALPAVTAVFERFESVAASVPEELVPAHRVFCRRQLHPLLMCAPFMHRIYTKPLGYAGDYEMIDMIIRNECEGSSLFSKLLQVFILDQAPARSVRNRVDYFVQKFMQETSRVASLGRPANIFSLGCGPAREIQRFIEEQSLSERARFRLLDFNEETLRYAGTQLDEVKRRSKRRTQINLVRKSVHNLLRAGAKPAADEGKYDFIYCSGLYDYLNDRICKTLNGYLYEQLAPGGLLVVTNFDPSNPIRRIQEHIFDWFLIYRDGRELARLAPDQAIQDNCAVKAEYTGCNIFLEIRKPE